MEDWYPQDYADSLRISLAAIKSCNIRFDDESSFIRKNWRYAYILPLMTTHFFSFYLSLLEIFTKTGNFFKQADVMPLWFVTIQVLLKVVILMKHRLQLKAAMQNLGRVWMELKLSPQLAEMKVEFIKRQHSGQRIFKGFTGSICVIFLMLPLLQTIFKRLILKKDFEMSMPFDYVYPFKVDTWGIFLVAYFVQIIAILIIVLAYLGTDLLLIVLCSFVSTLFKILGHDLLHMKPTNKKRIDNNTVEYDQTEKILDDWVQRHQRAISLISELNKIFDRVTFVNLLFATLSICFYALSCKAATGTEEIMTKGGALISILLVVLLTCYCSEMLNSASAAIGDAALENPWLDGDKSYITKMCIILMRSQKPCSLTSYYAPISLKTFTKVLSSTWSYFSLVNTFYDASDN